ITGTDTGVGKTSVTCALATVLRARGKRVVCAKPIESGGGDDAHRIAWAAGHPPICLYPFAAPVAPRAAAEATGGPLDLPAIARALAEHPHDTMRVEGAGGLLCPLGGTRTIADLAAELALPLLVVARAGLGTINHTLLTVSEARRRGLALAGVII